MDCAAWIQAISSVVLVLVTIAYVILTNKIAKQGAATGWLEPIDFDEVYGEQVILRIKNVGPGHAIKCKASLTLKKGERKANENGNVNLEFLELPLRGSSRILEGEEDEYKCKSKDGKVIAIAAKMNLKIEWFSITGNKFQYTWLYNQGEEGRGNWSIMD